MKKAMMLMLALLILISLTACGGEADPEQVITMATQAPEETQQVEAAGMEKPFTFCVNGVDLIPGNAFDPAWLPEAEAIYEVPSCAIEGMDIVYQYGDFEVTAVDDGSGAVVYSVYFLSPELTTPEGLALGDSAEKAESLYGTGCAQENSARIYSGADTQLILILNGDSVSSIEYRWVP